MPFPTTRRCYTGAVAILLALLSAACYGVSDYVGGRTSRRVAPVVVSLLAEVVLLVVFAATVPVIEADGPTAGAVG